MKTTKILFAVGLFIAFAFIVALILAVILNLQPSRVSSNDNVPNNINSSDSVAGSTPQISLTSEEVAKHNNASDCWMIINGRVYDLTSLAYSHSGGSQDILQDCGKDGSLGFNSPHGTDTHSSSAHSIIEGFYIGDLGQQIGTAELQNKTEAIANTTVQRNREREDDDEYEDD